MRSYSYTLRRAIVISGKNECQAIAINLGPVCPLFRGCSLNETLNYTETKKANSHFRKPFNHFQILCIFFQGNIQFPCDTHEQHF